MTRAHVEAPGEGSPSPWRWDVASYQRAAEAGAWGTSPRVELVEGEVYAVAPMRSPHAFAVVRLDDAASATVDRTSFSVRVQLPARLDESSEPEPDLAIARGGAEAYADHHPGPGELLLVVEVAGSSLAFDLTVKVPAYAAAGVPEVWLVSLPERRFVRFSDPAPAERVYRTRRIEAEHADVRHAPTGFRVTPSALFPPP